MVRLTNGNRASTPQKRIEINSYPLFSLYLRWCEGIVAFLNLIKVATLTPHLHFALLNCSHFSFVGMLGVIHRSRSYEVKHATPLYFPFPKVSLSTI